jgi:hypothetical protein
MKRTLFVTLVLVLAVVMTASSQTFEVRLARTINANTLTIDVMLGNASPAFVPGTMTLLFNYNTSALSTPVRVSANDGPWRAANDADYNALLLSTGAGYAGLTVEFAGGDNNNGPTVTAAFTRVGSISFTILNKSLLPSLTWMGKGVTTQVFKVTTPGTAPDQTDITVNGTFTNPVDQPLPITLASFLVSPGSSSGNVKIEWATLSETNNYGFEVERSADSSGSFETVPNSFVAGHGTTLDAHSYAFVDVSAGPGRWFYRLKQTDLDGGARYSEAKSLDIVAGLRESAPIAFALLQNYPNPFNPQSNIKFSVEQTGRATLQVYSITGQLVATLFDGLAESGQYYAVTFGGGKFASGAYIYRLQSGGKSSVKRMLLIR